MLSAGRSSKSTKKAFRRRTIIQALFVIVTNAYLVGFAKGTIYTGSLKAACLPGLNCYSCPGALGSCPIGAMQVFTGARGFTFPLYVVGFLTVIGAFLGRFVCGFLCPFGLLQDLIYKIPFLRKIGTLPGDKFLKYLPYAILIIFVILMPMFIVDTTGLGAPAFCKYICPSGTFGAGIPLVLTNSGIASSIGVLFWWKMTILVLVLALSVISYRPFCRYLCPLGAVYGLFNPLALYGFEVDKNKCTECGTCQKKCKWHIDTKTTPNSRECIRCGDCLTACPEDAISCKWNRKSYNQRREGVLK